MGFKGMLVNVDQVIWQLLEKSMEQKNVLFSVNEVCGNMQSTIHGQEIHLRI